ncbi:sigma-E processing peptidase SpoIIGA [Mesobacillus zeae]|uniref:Sporulation sigma-E factor-processing peptidase n=1 Tax=Mesobacillus zeae TaxID=1917180 RepID=A0A398BDX8_9BACI|nr:sigma-E processing peptidase SpoIIGA [Mesobacillus zeae]RID88142.1 sigma-E processing peptidase SpoIIGA [Mesobacillus zeae]
MTVYLDIIWALNLMFDSLLLYLTAILLKRSVRAWRVCCGGLIGSILILLPLTPLQELAGYPLVKLGFSIIMVLVAFGFKRLGDFVRCLMVFYLSTFMIGGALTGIHYAIQFDADWASSAALAEIKGFGDPVSWLFILLGFPFAWHFSKRNVENIEMATIQFGQLVTVKIGILGSSIVLKGIVDSGNQVYDPLSRFPVMFLSVKEIMDELPEAARTLAEEPDLLLTGGEIPPELEGNVKLIPYKVIGHEHQLRMAIKPDFIEIKKGPETYFVEKALVSLTLQQLSPDDRFQCIIHPKMLTGIPEVKASTG